MKMGTVGMTRNYLPGRWELAPFGRDFFEHDYEIRKPNYLFDNSVFCLGKGLWALTDSNRRPSACKADALNQLS